RGRGTAPWMEAGSTLTSDPARHLSDPPPATNFAGLFAAAAARTSFLSYTAPTLTRRSSSGQGRPFLVQPAKRSPKKMLIALNVFLATLVIVGIVGMLAWSIDSRDRHAPTA